MLQRNATNQCTVSSGSRKKSTSLCPLIDTNSHVTQRWRVDFRKPYQAVSLTEAQTYDARLWMVFDDQGEHRMLYHRYELNSKAAQATDRVIASNHARTGGSPVTVPKISRNGLLKICAATNYRLNTRDGTITFQTLNTFDKSAATRHAIGADYYASPSASRLLAANDTRPDAMTEALRARGVGRIDRLSFGASPEDKNVFHKTNSWARALIAAGLNLPQVIRNATSYFVRNRSHTMVLNSPDGRDVAVIGAGQQRSTVTGRRQAN